MCNNKPICQTNCTNCDINATENCHNSDDELIKWLNVELDKIPQADFILGDLEHIIIRRAWNKAWNIQQAKIDEIENRKCSDCEHSVKSEDIGLSRCDVLYCSHGVTKLVQPNFYCKYFERKHKGEANEKVEA